MRALLKEGLFVQVNLSWTGVQVAAEDLLHFQSSKGISVVYLTFTVTPVTLPSRLLKWIKCWFCGRWLASQGMGPDGVEGDFSSL